MAGYGCSNMPSSNVLSNDGLTEGIVDLSLSMGTTAHPGKSQDHIYDGARVLVVDDEPALLNLMNRILSNNRFQGVFACDGHEALEIIKNDPPALVVTDARMPKMDGWELCRHIRGNPDTMLLPVLMLTSVNSTSDRVRVFEAGANEYLPKPFQQVEIIARIRSMLRHAFWRSQLENAEQVIFTLARAVEAKDSYTAGHIERVSDLAVAIGRMLGVGDNDCSVLHRGGVLHDIGKIGVPDSILNKPGTLTPEEFEEIRKHPNVGEEICKSLKTLQPVLDMIRHHHERLDGSGYPDGLMGDQISLPARIMAVCDIYDALTSTRSYRTAMPIAKAFEILDAGVADGYWDEPVVRCLKNVIHEEQKTGKIVGEHEQTS